MSEIVIVNRGTATDLDAFLALADEAIALVEADLPGTLVYECYVDRQTSRFAWHEVYADGAAVLKHLDRFAEAGIVSRLPVLAEFDLALALGAGIDDGVRTQMEQMGFEFFAPHASAQR